MTDTKVAPPKLWIGVGACAALAGTVHPNKYNVKYKKTQLIGPTDTPSQKKGLCILVVIYTHATRCYSQLGQLVQRHHRPGLPIHRNC